MQYRKFGNTGVEVSALGFGCMRFPVQPGAASDAFIDEEQATAMLRKAIDAGVNYVDTAYMYHGGNSEPFVGKALRDGYREKVYLATKSPVFSEDYASRFDEILDEQLAKLQTDHIDFYLLHALNRKTFKNLVEKYNLLEKMKQAKASGKVRFIGFSFHDTNAQFIKIVDSMDWDFCQIQLNYVGTNYQAGLRGLAYAAEKGMGVVIMEPLLGGALAALSDQVAANLPKGKKQVEAALDFLWDRSEVSVVLSGMSTMEQVEQNLEYAEQSAIGMLTAADKKALAKTKSIFNASRLVNCTGCAYCMPCPAGVDIPGMYQAYNATASSTMERAAWIYSRKDGLATACVGCGKCEGVCPQHIPTVQLMPKIAEIFNK